MLSLQISLFLRHSCRVHECRELVLAGVWLTASQGVRFSIFFCFVDTHIDEHCLLARSGTLLYGRDSFEAEQAGANLVVSLCQVLFASVLTKLAQ